MAEKKAIGSTIGTVLAVCGGIFGCILIGFGALLVMASSDPTGDPAWLTVGAGMIVAALALIGIAVGYFAYVRARSKREAAGPQEIVQKIDLSGDIALEKLKCRNCGGELTQESITVREGAVFVSCPYCGVSYQMVEEPKW
jgi:DNA-directed RNA polymerase subunit RPC12/RpoP